MIKEKHILKHGFILENKQDDDKFSTYRKGEFVLGYSKDFRYRKNALYICKEMCNRSNRRMLFDGIVNNRFKLRQLLSMMGAGYNNV